MPTMLFLSRDLDLLHRSITAFRLLPSRRSRGIRYSDTGIVLDHYEGDLTQKYGKSFFFLKNTCKHAHAELLNTHVHMLPKYTIE